MSILEMFAIGFGGFLAGQLLFGRVMRWCATVYEIAVDTTNAGHRGKAWRIAIATVLGSGPWLFALAAWGAYAVHDEPYSVPLFVGAALGFVLLAFVAAHFALRMRKEAKNAA